MPNPAQNELAQALAAAGTSHHDYEQTILNGERDEQWSGFYAAYTLGRLGDGLYVGADEASRRLAALAFTGRCGSLPPHSPQPFRQNLVAGEVAEIGATTNDLLPNAVAGLRLRGAQCGQIPADVAEGVADGEECREHFPLEVGFARVGFDHVGFARVGHGIPVSASLNDGLGDGLVGSGIAGGGGGR